MLTSARIRVVLLDRDGVLNENRADYVTALDHWRWLPGAREACRRLIEHGLKLGVVTNQRAVARGLLDVAVLDRIHDAMRVEITDDDEAMVICACVHDRAAGCPCRKPRPGLLHEVLDRFGVSPREALMVGDHASDVLAGQAAGCWTLHVRSGRQIEPPVVVSSMHLGSVRDLADAVEHLLSGCLSDVVVHRGMA